jgi:hypothetical protein
LSFPEGESIEANDAPHNDPAVDDRLTLPKADPDLLALWVDIAASVSGDVDVPVKGESK